MPTTGKTLLATETVTRRAAPAMTPNPARSRVVAETVVVPSVA